MPAILEEPLEDYRTERQLQAPLAQQAVLNDAVRRSSSMNTIVQRAMKRRRRRTVKVAAGDMLGGALRNWNQMDQRYGIQLPPARQPPVTLGRVAGAFPNAFSGIAGMLGGAGMATAGTVGRVLPGAAGEFAKATAEEGGRVFGAGAHQFNYPMRSTALWDHLRQNTENVRAMPNTPETRIMGFSPQSGAAVADAAVGSMPYAMAAAPFAKGMPLAGVANAAAPAAAAATMTGRATQLAGRGAMAASPIAAAAIHPEVTIAGEGPSPGQPNVPGPQPPSGAAPPAPAPPQQAAPPQPAPQAQPPSQPAAPPPKPLQPGDSAGMEMGSPGASAPGPNAPAEGPPRPPQPSLTQRWQAGEALTMDHYRDIPDHELPEQIQQLPEQYRSTAIQQASQQRVTDALSQSGMSPEEQHKALGQIMAKVEQGGFTPEDLQELTPLVQHQLGLQNKPEAAHSVFDSLKQMSPWQIGALAIGVPLGLVGLMHMFGGGDMLSGLVMSVLGLGTAAYGSGMFDKQLGEWGLPTMNQLTSGFGSKPQAQAPAPSQIGDHTGMQMNMPPGVAAAGPQQAAAPSQAPTQAPAPQSPGWAQPYISGGTDPNALDPGDVPGLLSAWQGGQIHDDQLQQLTSSLTPDARRNLSRLLNPYSRHMATMFLPPDQQQVVQQLTPYLERLTPEQVKRLRGILAA